MTAPDLPAGWHVTDDAVGERTLWCGDVAVWRESDFAPAGAEWRDLLWDVLTRALAPNDDTVLRLAIAAHENYPLLAPDMRAIARLRTKRTLAALAGTSAQARYTADDATEDA